MSNNPLEAVTQAVNSLVTALKLPDESAKANEVLGEMSFPQFSRLLPYRDYNQESGLFMNDTTMGFMLEAIPINGANKSIVEALDHMLRTKLPRGIPLCIHLMSSQLVGDRIEYGLRELPVGINATRQIAAAQQEMAREASNRAESALHGFSSSIASAWNSLSQFGSNRGSSDSVTGGADSTMSAQDSMMASRMRSAVESYAKAHNISNEQATQELASRSTRASAGMYGDAHAEWGVKPKILGVGGGLGVRGGGRAGIDWEDNDAHTASSNTQSSHNARHDIDARATQDFKEASDYFTSRKVSESGSHTDNNADSRVDQLSAALNSAKQSYDQYTTNMTRSHEYAEMASRTESMSGQMSEDLSQQFAQYVMKHAPQDAEAILTNTSSPEIAERRRAMAWSFVQEQVQPGVDNAWRESRGDIGKGMESVPSGGGSQDIIADHQGHQAIIDQRTQDSNIRNDVKHQVDNMVTEYKGNIGDTQNSVRGEENIVRGQYSELQNHHKTEALSQNNKYNEEKSAQERMPGADSPQELMKRAKEYQDKYKQ
ncbi:TPA: TraC family protein [Escherichia coli]